jgi:hypothetical protein
MGVQNYCKLSACGGWLLFFNPKVKIKNSKKHAAGF